jgi:hypothetical protein
MDKATRYSGRMKQLGFVCMGVMLALGATSFADPPGWSRGQQELRITWEECVKRAGDALQAESYRIEQPSPFAVGMKGQHTAVIMCNPAPGNKQWVNIVVASNGEGGGTERQRLQGRMDGSVTGGGQPPGPPQPPQPPPTGEGCAGADYSVRTDIGPNIRPKQEFTIRFSSRGPYNPKDWISVYKLPNPAEKYYYWTYVNHPNIKSCGWTLSLYELGEYGIAYFKDGNPTPVATTRINITDTTGASNQRVNPPTPPAQPPKAVAFLGCFKDSNSPFDLDGHLETSERLTPQSCIATCASRNFAYAGVQYAHSCLCGNKYGTQGQAANCNMRCTGDPNQNCGGSYANAVYSTGR